MWRGHCSRHNSVLLGVWTGRTRGAARPGSMAWSRVRSSSENGSPEFPITMGQLAGGLRFPHVPLQVESQKTASHRRSSPDMVAALLVIWLTASFTRKAWRRSRRPQTTSGRSSTSCSTSRKAKERSKGVAPIRSAKRATRYTRVQLAENRQHSDTPECIMSKELPIYSELWSPPRGRLSAVGYALRNEL